MHSGYARVITNGSELWIRFERIGRGNKFNIVLDAFRHSFPLAEWDESHKAWKMPANQLDQVVKFCSRVVGRVQIQSYDTTFAVARQLGLL